MNGPLTFTETCNALRDARRAHLAAIDVTDAAKIAHVDAQTAQTAALLAEDDARDALDALIDAEVRK